MFVPDRIGRYRITAELGRGGMGVVYSALDQDTSRLVAIKVLSDVFERDDEVRARFLREADIVARLRHPNIVSVLDAGEDHGRPFLVMQLLTGTTLAARVKALGTGDILGKLDLMVQACEGVAAAHARGIVHRDLKPGNVAVEPNGQVKILDFGVARVHDSQMTVVGTMLGTPDYMSPEQSRGEPVGLSSDVFSIGALSYFTLTGRAPFAGPTTEVVLSRLQNEPPSPMDASVPTRLEVIVTAALAKDPHDRPRCIEDYLVALLQFRREYEAETRAPGHSVTPVHAFEGPLPDHGDDDFAEGWPANPGQGVSRPELRSDSTFGEFTVVKRLGRGSMGVVYEAVDPDGRHVAIKTIAPELVLETGTRIRFLREARLAGKLRHRNIVEVHGANVHEGVPYICMELLEGTTLAQALSRGDSFSPAQALAIIAQLCDGLQYAHDHGVVHRDIKPANIWLLEDGSVKLLDFGVAKSVESTITRAGDVVGSAAYMAPEQFTGEAVDGRADLFGAGAVLYQLLSGHGPFEADSFAAVAHKVLHVDPPSLRTTVPNLADTIVLAVDRALARDRDHRYARAGDFGADLRVAFHQLSKSWDGPRSGDGATVIAPIVRSAAGPAVAVEVPILTEPDVRPHSGRRLWAFGTAAVMVVLALVVWAWPVLFRPDPTFHVEVKSVPPGASVELDGVATGVTTPATVTVQRRPSLVTLAMDGFESASAPITAPDGADSADVQLALRRLLMVESNPAGGRILLGGVDTGLVTPAPVPLPDPRPAFVEVQLGAGRTGRVELTDAIVAKGTVTVPVPQQSGQGLDRRGGSGLGNVALRIIGGYPFAVVGCGVSSPPATEHQLTVRSPCTVRLRAPEYHLDASRSVPAASGQVEMAAPQLARVQLRTRYEGCPVLIGGRSLGSPPIDVELAAGSYDITIACQDKTLVARGVVIEPGRSIRRLDDYVP